MSSNPTGICNDNVDPSAIPDRRCFSVERFVTIVFDILTVLVPATLPICITFNTFYFHFHLNNQGITSVSEQRLNSAGKANIVILDKTGTLTEEELDLYGFQATSILKNKISEEIKENDFNNNMNNNVNNINNANNNVNDISDDDVNYNNNLVFNEVETNAWLYNLLHLEFWKNYCSYQNYFQSDDYKNNVKNSSIYFLEYLACCHDINKINDSSLGRSIDLKIFGNLQWELEKCVDNEEGVII